MDTLLAKITYFTQILLLFYPKYLPLRKNRQHGHTFNQYLTINRHKEFCNNI